MTFDQETTAQLEEILVAKKIKQISFVLSDDNLILSNAMNAQSIDTIEVMQQYYGEVDEECAIAVELWKECDFKNVILRNFLSRKMEDLNNSLKSFDRNQIELGAMIYSRENNNFTNIQLTSSFRNRYNLN